MELAISGALGSQQASRAYTALGQQTVQSGISIQRERFFIVKPNERQSERGKTACKASLQQSSGGSGGDGFSTTSGQTLVEQTAPNPIYVISVTQEPIVLTLASFAVTKIAYVRITKLFKEQYIKRTGIDVRFKLSFGGSGTQARAVIDGLPADLVALALPLDVQKISDAGLINKGWRKRYPSNSTVCETTVAIVTRKGNPHDISTWDDLTKGTSSIVVANPKTAGVSRWIFLALWGHRMKSGAQASIDYVTKVFENVPIQPRDAREASDVFYRQKIGDVLLTYENEVILTNRTYGESGSMPYAVPKYNVRIECPLSLVDKVVDSRPPIVRKVADDFAKFLFSDDAQGQFAEVGFRINPKVSKTVARQQEGIPNTKLWTVDKELGGWDRTQQRFFDANAILDNIQSEVGRRRMLARRQR